MKLLWKVRKILQPKFIAERNAYIQSHINYCESLSKWMGEKNFNDRCGVGYIDRLKNDLV